MLIPPRTATELYLSESGGGIDIAFDIDLGELTEGHHVIARGVELERRSFTRALARGSRYIQSNYSVLHYEEVPGRTPESTAPTWGYSVVDDIGTAYSDEFGGVDDFDGGVATHGFRNIGLTTIPSSASILTFAFHPSWGWTPPEPWRRTLILDLRRKDVLD
jgi:hypothetical protein